MNQKLCPSPGKMILSFLCKACWTHLYGVILHHEFISTKTPGVTVEVTFSPLKELTSTRVKAAHADDVGVDISD